MAVDAGDIVYSIGGDTAALDQALTESVQMAEGKSADYGAAIGTIGTASVVAGGAITGALGAMALGWAASGDELDKMSQRTGVGVTELDKMKFILEQNGASLGDFERGQRGLITALDDAADGTGRNAEALERLGIDYDELRAMAPEEQFQTVAFAIGEMEDHTDQAAMAMQLFGSRVGTQLLPMIKGGEEAFHALGARAEELGLHTDESAARAAEFTDTMNELKHAFQGVMITIGEFVAETLIPMIEGMISAVIAVNDWAKENEALASVLTKVVGGVGALLLAFGLIVKVAAPIVAVVKAVGIVFGVAAGILSGPVIAAILAVVATAALIYAFWDEIKYAFEFYSDAVVAIVTAWWEMLTATWSAGISVVSAVVSAWWEGMKAVWGGAADVITSITSAWWGAVTAAFQAGAAAVSAVWDAVVSVTMAAVEGVVAGFGYLWDGAVAAFDGLRNFVADVWSEITGIITGAWDAISGVVTNIIDAIGSAIQAAAGLIGISAGVGAGGGAPPTAKASGGPVKAGQPTLVGERGREMFVPRVDGRILTHTQTAGAMGGGGDMTINMGGVTVASDMDIHKVVARMGELMRQRMTGIGRSPAGERI